MPFFSWYKYNFKFTKLRVPEDQPKDRADSKIKTLFIHWACYQVCVNLLLVKSWPTFYFLIHVFSSVMLLVKWKWNSCLSTETDANVQNRCHLCLLTGRTWTLKHLSRYSLGWKSKLYIFSNCYIVPHLSSLIWTDSFVSRL